MNTKTIRAHVQTVPGYTPFQDDLYLSGTFNDWNPADPRYAFQRNADGSFSLTFQYVMDLLECKITRGSWSSAEGDGQGKSKLNRFLITKKEEMDFWFTIDSWMDVEKTPMFSAREAIVLHPAFKIPQLNRKRKIWAHLPYDYRSSKKSYPVIYMMDGQNLFSGDETKSSWNVDQAMKQLLFKSNTIDHDHEVNALHQYIIIGIEHGEEHRIDEYSAWKNESYGGGEAPQLLDFLCTTLKPYVDQHLRSLKDREHTIIMGSSMGGLFSLYAALERQDVFGNAGIFSPSLWFSPEILKYVKKKKIKMGSRFLLMAGQKESDSMTEDLLDLYDTLLEAGHDDEAIHYDLHTNGSHNEHFWAKEFEHALDWLSSNDHMHEKGIISNENFKFSFNPFQRELIIFIDDDVDSPGLKVNDFCHDRVFHYSLFHGSNRISYADWQECLYTIRLMADQDLIFSRRVHLNQLPVEAETILVN
jgi:predicted alpha/beta superfamily hydrolase